MHDAPLSLGEIKARLVKAGYPRPESGAPTVQIRNITREAQEARAELRDHIIEDIWALIDELESLRGRAKP